MNSPLEPISHAALSDLAVSSHIPEATRYRAQLLLEACEDWPELNVVEPAAVLGSLRAAVAAPLTYANLVAYAKAVADDSWRSESLASFLELFRDGATFRDQVTLDELVAELQ
jgi:hypothetical protein